MNNQSSYPHDLPPPVAPDLKPASIYESSLNDMMPQTKIKLDQLAAQGFPKGQSFYKVMMIFVFKIECLLHQNL